MIDLHLIMGGVRSGKSSHAQALAQGAERDDSARVVVLATALGADAEMRARIERHRAERPAHWRAIEIEPSERGLGDAIASQALPGTALLVDCTTLWLSQLICPPEGVAAVDASLACAHGLSALAAAEGRAIVVGNEIGLGVMPIDAATRRVVDALGHFHQALARSAREVTWMVAGLPLVVKGAGR